MNRCLNCRHALPQENEYGLNWCEKRLVHVHNDFTCPLFAIRLSALLQANERGEIAQ